MRKIDAKNIMNVLVWLDLEHPSNKFKYKPKPDKEGGYKCSIHLPVIDIKCNGFGKTKLDAIDKCANLAWGLIEATIDDLNTWHFYKGAFVKSFDYVGVEDDSGNFYIGPNTSVPDAFA